MKINRIFILAVASIAILSCVQDESHDESTYKQQNCYSIANNKLYADCMLTQYPDTNMLMFDIDTLNGIPDLSKFNNLSIIYITAANGDLQPNDFSRIFTCENLVELHISKSKITNLPVGIGALKNLERLSIMGGAMLTELPHDIVTLKRLKVINVWRNNLDEKSLPLSEMRALEKLVIGQNHKVSVDKLNREWPNITIIDFDLENR